MAANLRDRVVLVTGSSAGIGFAISRRLAYLGMTVVGCARNIDNIEVCFISFI